MNYKSESKVLDNMKSIDDSKYKKDDKIIIIVDHMFGMKNVKGIVKGVYKMYVYVVSYIFINGDEKVNNYKWVVNEEVVDVFENGFKKGDIVKLEVDYMFGMKGVEV